MYRNNGIKKEYIELENVGDLEKLFTKVLNRKITPIELLKFSKSFLGD